MVATTFSSCLSASLSIATRKHCRAFSFTSERLTAASAGTGGTNAIGKSKQRRELRTQLFTTSFASCKGLISAAAKLKRAFSFTSCRLTSGVACAFCAPLTSSKLMQFTWASTRSPTSSVETSFQLTSLDALTVERVPPQLATLIGRESAAVAALRTSSACWLHAFSLSLAQVLKMLSKTSSAETRSSVAPAHLPPAMMASRKRPVMRPVRSVEQAFCAASTSGVSAGTDRTVLPHATAGCSTLDARRSSIGWQASMRISICTTREITSIILFKMLTSEMPKRPQFDNSKASGTCRPVAS
mmetsp:Transcript_122717/g.261885  ORF Transcript_122717/g.261885 Transcript_122717/m.261885 type:complete len:300 (-) Transcript_122717:565-1464(-)